MTEAPSELPPEHTGPGLVDLQANGYAGFDFNSDPALWRVQEFARVRDVCGQRGVVAVLPTFITDAPERLVARAARYRNILEEAPELERFYPGLHIEGPFISPEEGPRGAHPLAHCRTPAEAPDLLDRLVDASGGRIRMLTLAPELPGALDLIREIGRRGIVPAIGHTNASAERLSEAADAGARASTHLGNGSHQVLPRHANYIQAQLAEDRLIATFIADGHHIPWYALRNYLRAKTPERSILVSDAVAAADAPPGRYRLGEQEVEASEDRLVRAPGQPNLAGSALTLDRALLNVVRYCGVSFQQAWQMASIRPAELIGLPEPESIRVEILSSVQGAKFKVHGAANYRDKHLAP